MTIRSSIDARTLNIQLTHLERCADDAPAGTHVQAKSIAGAFGDIYDVVRERFTEAGLKVPNDDRWREVEAVIYGAIKSANPDATVFPLAEGFGEKMDGPNRERILDQTTRDRDFLKSVQAQQ